VIFAAVLLLASAAPQSMVMHRHTPGKLAPVAQIIERHAIARGVDAKLALGSISNIPMGGNVFPVGIYWLEVGVGTPTKYYGVAIDSGSCTLIIPGYPCDGCTSKIAYHPSQSATSKSIPCPSFDYGCFSCSGNNCSYSNSYQTCVMTDPDQTCTVSGLAYVDKFNLGGLTGTTTLGTITYQTSNFVQFQVIDGVMGFACESQWNMPTPLQDLVNNGKIRNQFSYCMDSNGQGGVFTVGGADPKYYTGDFQYTPFTGDGSGLYTVNLNDIHVGPKSLGLPPYVYNNPMYGGTTIDSGTNVLLLPSTAFNAMHTVFRSLCSTTNLYGVCDSNSTNTIFHNGLCFPMTQAQREMYPPLTLTFDPNTKVTMSHKEYIIEFTPGSGQWCLGVINTGPSGFTIIGDTTMAPYTLLFDRELNRLGFAKVNTNTCKYTGQPPH